MRAIANIDHYRASHLTEWYTKANEPFTPIVYDEAYAKTMTTATVEQCKFWQVFSSIRIMSSTTPNHWIRYSFRRDSDMWSIGPGLHGTFIDPRWLRMDIYTIIREEQQRLEKIVENLK